VATVMLGNGDGTFRFYEGYSSGPTQPRSLAVVDLNGDGRPDLIVGHACGRCEQPGLNLAVLLNRSFAPTTTGITSSPNPSLLNQSVTFTATVSSTSSSVPNGSTVAFSDGKGQLGTGTITNGIATLTTSFSAAKTYTVRANYLGDVFHQSSSPIVKQVVNP
jgi:hypothetical protein